MSVEIPIKKITSVFVGMEGDCVDKESPTLAMTITLVKKVDLRAFLCAVGFKKDALCIFFGFLSRIEFEAKEMEIVSPLLIVGSGKSVSLSVYKKGVGGAGDELAILSSMTSQKKVVRMFLHLKDFQFSY